VDESNERKRARKRNQREVCVSVCNQQRERVCVCCSSGGNMDLLHRLCVFVVEPHTYEKSANDFPPISRGGQSKHFFSEWVDKERDGVCFGVDEARKRASGCV
jgi:hypothetical protein